MKIFILAALLVSAPAYARPNTQHLTAAQAKDLVTKRGAIVLSTSSFGYDRFVANQSLCGGERAVAAYVPTLDSDAAFIGYACVNHSSNDAVSSKRYARNMTKCKEGSIQRLQERERASDSQENFQRICTDGKWKRMAGVDPVGPKKVACKEDTYSFSTEGNVQNSVTTICRAGKWRKLN